ncbi:MAG: MBL fold metallo-hydrolase [Thermodesulfobacteriota bacterium]|nr:MBL fold metallo-hydrolase [Thermodesulfobacteriota bacterium]
MSFRKPHIAHPKPILTHLGGKDTVTGSCHLLTTVGISILVDCGLAQGHDSVQPMTEWEIHPREIDYLFLTHAHIDHIGRLPELIATGFSGEIICSHATKSLLVPLLKDALSFTDYSKEQKSQLLTAVQDLSWGFEYGQSFSLKKEIRFILGRAGHILGSSFLCLQIPMEKARVWSVVFSGDLGNYNTPLLPDPDAPPACDLLVLESTYGDRLHEDRTHRLECLGKTLVNALADNGKVFIPAFSLGRTQELLYELDRLFSDEEWSRQFPELQQQGRGKAPVPVFVDSPLALQITEIYNELSAFWDEESKKSLADNDHPFDFRDLYSVKRFKEHQQILDFPGSAIIIAGSGMCTGGRIVNHLLTGLGKKENDVLFIGYQAQGTPGRDILKYANSHGYVRLKHQKITILARVHKVTGYSAHADQKGLLDWVAAMPAKPGSIRLVHGEKTAQDVLTDKLSAQGYRVI